MAQTWAIATRTLECLGKVWLKFLSAILSFENKGRIRERRDNDNTGGEGISRRRSNVIAGVTSGRLNFFARFFGSRQEQEKRRRKSVKLHVVAVSVVVEVLSDGSSGA